MSKQWKWTLAAVCACVLALAAPQVEGQSPGQAPYDPTGLEAGADVGLNLLDLRVNTDADGEPVVTLAADGPVTYESFILDGPDRLVLDLPGVVSRLDQYRFAVGLGGVASVRAAQHVVEPVPVTRVVFDLEQPLAYRIDQRSTDLTIAFGEPEDPPAEGVRTVESRQSEPPSEVDWAAPPTTTVAVAEEQEPELDADKPATAAEAAPAPAATAELSDDTTDADSPSIAEVLAQTKTETPAEAEPVVVESTTEDADQDTVAEASSAGAGETDSRSVSTDVIDRLLTTPAMAAPQQEAAPATPTSFEPNVIVTDKVTYTGRRISLNLVDADIKQVFRLFHEISGLNFVLDPGVSGRVTIVLDQVPWDQALDIILKTNSLDKVLDGNVLRIASTASLANEAAQRRALREAEELEVEPITLTRTLSYAKARDVERVIREGGILSQRGSVIVDERTNTLIMSDVPKKVEPIDALISTLDAETPQVMIEARIVETSRDYVKDLGIVWGFSASADAAHGTQFNSGAVRNVASSYDLNLPGSGGASALAFSLSNIVDSFTLDVQLNALEGEGYARILSSPKVATQNNERAEIEQGVRIPIVNTTATEINVEFVSASLRLIVTPQITAEGTIILDLEVENNSPDFVNTSGDVPSIRTQRAQTKVLINDGGTTVIGGIFTVNEGQSEVGVPWFRKIPGFQWLFRTKNITQQNRELLIFITPKIVKLG
jgi:type IV pilus assembly protein PilQ